MSKSKSSIGQKFQELLYYLSTDDKYSEYDSRKSFNRINKPDSENLLTVYSQHSTSSLELNNVNTTTTTTTTNSNEPNDNPEGIHEMKLAWRHIKSWLLKNAPDMNSSLSSKCTNSDLKDFQKDLNIKLPKCVLEFFKITDGQSNFGNKLNIETNGLIFGLKLMSLDEIMISTENWRKVADFIHLEENKENQKLNELSKLPISHPNSNQIKKKLSLNTSSELSSTSNSFDLSLEENSRKTSVSSHDSSSSSSNNNYNKSNKNSNMPKQRCLPPGTVHETFAHPMWIPLVTDEVGNYIGIDLSPPKGGKWGQVILFGRDFDFKFKISDTWGDFLLIFANDLEIGNWEIKTNKKNNYGDLFIGNEGELVFVDKESKMEIPYLEMLKRRAVKKWMNTLENESSDDINKELLQELKQNEVSILSLNNKNFQSVDSFINNNLNLIDNVKPQEKVEEKISLKPISSIKTAPSKLPCKSPLSQEVTEEEIEEDAGDEDQTITNIEKTLDEVDIKN
ncbi:SMI1 [Candida pseudojiufengensis]|uniref:SMI1 n=1 Tax=Candida pseudojiufengensis TaxID=497109 RepID=UPI0022245F5E|nr:SMI1 [Candida pseudojiufengensis]KAI5960994.1 SMI1 [Candida pseudojiufengensis]